MRYSRGLRSWESRLEACELDAPELVEVEACELDASEPVIMDVWELGLVAKEAWDLAEPRDLREPCELIQSCKMVDSCVAEWRVSAPVCEHAAAAWRNSVSSGPLYAPPTSSSK